MSDPGPFSFDDVFKAELEEVHKAGVLRGCGAADSNVLLGLSLSGGGIRSATFNLGILQALAELKILRGFDYLSTVSGGGYIGSWLVSWIKRDGIKEVEEKLAPQDAAGQKGDEPGPIRWLRDYSNYLTPHVGLFTADTWTVLSVYMRNLLLNQVIICAAISALLAVPWVARQAVDLNYPFALPLVGLTLLVVAVYRVGFALSTFSCESGGPSQKNIQLTVVLPLVLSAWVLSIWWAQVSVPYAEKLWRQPGHVVPLGGIISGIVADAFALKDPHGVFFGAIAAGLCAIVLMALCAARARFWVCFDPDRDGFADSDLPRNGRRWKMAGVLLLAILVPGVLAAVLMCVLTVDFAAFSEPQLFATHVTVFGMPLFIGLLTLVIVLHLGLFGVNYPDERREWWSRVGAWLVIAVSAWIGLFVISLYSPSFFQWLFSWTSGPDRWTNPKMWSTLSAWAATTAGGLMAGRSANTGKAAADNEPSNRWLNLLAKIAPIVFAVGLFAILSALLATIIDKTHSAFWVMFWAAVIAFVLSWRIDVDEFSMHHFYKNRLARCYLGASAGAARRANRFTGFDRNDDIRLACFSNWNEPGVARPCDKNERAYDGPYPILNTTLNLAYGEKLAWQQRKGASFIFTPRYCGFSRIDSDDVTDSYRPTAQYAKRGGLAIGTPLAVSGAAVSPNWGYHTSPTVAFLLTVFNVRLGWWLGNPSRDKWQRTAPGLGLLYLVTELLGFANNRRKYVYLSDGGHFDNMGLYELVRRRCRFIVVCDGEEDHAYTFGGIGSAIRQCRADFGVEIEIDFDALRPKDGKRSSAHCSIGKIYYPAVRKSAESQPPMSGTLVYLKATLTGDEPADVLEFAARAHEFPHQTTADQFFDESQFESYRRLGYHVGKRTFSPVATGQPNVLSAPTMFTPITDRETFFVRMRQHWYTSGAPDRRLFARHGDALDQLFERQRKDERLRFLDAQIYPEWRALQHAAGDGSGGAQLWIPKDEDTMREGFYFCNSLLQLMEDVYVDLDLEHEYDNPDNGGWMNLFRHWAWSGMFRVTWSISSPTYGARFANFCREKLELSRGQLHLGDAMNTLDAINDSSLSFLEQDRVRKAIDLALLDSFSVTPFEIHVLDPRSSKNELIFPVGFVLTEGRKLWYFRIQNHLRKMGLGRKALALAIGHNRVDGIAEPLTTPEFSDPKVLKKPEVLEKPELLKKLKALQEPKALKLWPADRVRTLRALHESAQRLACEHNLLIEIIEA